MKVIVKEHPKLNLIGLSIKTTLKENKIPELWIKFIKKMPEIDDITVPQCSIGLIMEKEIVHFKKDTPFQYMAAKILKKGVRSPEGFEKFTIPGGLYAVFTHEGSIDNLSELYDYIYNVWFSASVFNKRKGYEFEWYDSRYKYNDPQTKIDIHIPVERAFTV